MFAIDSCHFCAVLPSALVYITLYSKKNMQMLTCQVYDKGALYFCYPVHPSDVANKYDVSLAIVCRIALFFHMANYITYLT